VSSASCYLFCYAGQKCIEHLTGVALGASSEEETLFAVKWTQTGDFLRRDVRAEATYNESKAAALFAQFIKNGTWQCPTLVVNRSYGGGGAEQVDLTCASADVRFA
jgi:hypothetical protein